ncbi:hypothetical protein ACLOJK_029703, partial [Asimina triloba]
MQTQGQTRMPQSSREQLTQFQEIPAEEVFKTPPIITQAACLTCRMHLLKTPSRDRCT